MGPVDSLDHASRLPNYGSKMGVDATRKWPAEGFTRPWPKVIRMAPEVGKAGRRSSGSARACDRQAGCYPGPCALSCFGLVVGGWLKRRIPLLDDLNIPAPIVGGLLYALAMLGLRGHVDFDDGVVAAARADGRVLHERRPGREHRACEEGWPAGAAVPRGCDDRRSASERARNRPGDSFSASIRCSASYPDRSR